MPAEDQVAVAGGPFDAILASYLEAEETHPGINRETWLTQHPGVSQELSSFFAAVDEVSRITRPFRREPMPGVGQWFGDYELLEEIGRGGMGVVFRARQLRLDRLVALKMIHLAVQHGAKDIQRFQNEAEAASRLDHPNIVPVYDFGEVHGQQFISMKLIEGQNLAEWHARGDQHSPREKAIGKAEQIRIARIVMQIARAVHYAHQRGILHRDIKPSNILLREDDHPFVADFGLAKLLFRDQELTQAGALLGTPSYMAPEQFGPLAAEHPVHNMHPSAATTLVDIYGLGAVLYFLLTGQPPFLAETALATIALARDTEVIRPRQLVSGLDQDLEAICLKCLERQPQARYETAEALSVDLECWASGLPTLARPATRLEQIRRWCVRNPLLSSLIAGMVATSVFGVGALVTGLNKANDARNEAVAARQTALANLRLIIAEINDLENRRPDLDETRLELLSRVQDQLEPMLSDPAHGTLADETNFWLQLDAGDVEKQRLNTQAARVHFVRALEISQRLLQLPEATRARLKSFALSRMGDLLQLEKQFRDGIESYEETLAIRQQLVDTNPTSQARADLALAHLKLSTGFIRFAEDSRQTAPFEESITHSQSGLALYEKLVIEEPHDVWHARMLGYAHESLADAHFRLGHISKAIEHGNKGVESLKAAQVRMPQYQLIFDMHMSYLLDVLSWSYAACGMYEQGAQTAADSLLIRQRLVEPSPQAFFLRRAMTWSLDRQGNNLQGLGRTAEALDTFQQAVRQSEALSAMRPELGDIRAELFVFLDRCFEAGLPDPSFDEQTLAVALKRVELETVAYQANPQDSRLGDRLFRDLIQLAEFHLLRGESALAVQSLLQAQNQIHAAVKSDRADPQREIDVRLELARQFSQPGFDAANALMEVTQTECMLARLARIFRERNDHARLAKACMSLSNVASGFRQNYAAAQGLAAAASIAPEVDAREQYLQQRDQLLSRLMQHGPHVARRIEADPVFAETPFAPDKELPMP